VDKPASQFVNELLTGAGPELVQVDRAVWAPAPDAPDGPTAGQALVRRVMPLPSRRERRLALRLRATELIGLLEGTDPADPETGAAREGLAGELAAIARAVTTSADDARAAGLDPLTLRDVAGADGPGASLLQVAPLPSRFSYSAFSVYEACPLRYAFQYVYRIPGPERPVGAFAFGGIAHATFEAFTKERRERAARGEPPPTRRDLEDAFRARWTPTAFPDQTAEAHYQRRVATLLDNFWEGEAAAEGEVIAEEQGFELTLDPGDGSPPVTVTGSIDRIDRLPSGRVEVIDYKTGKISSQKDVTESLQLSIYALACRDVLGLGTPERVTLAFTESATRMSTTRTDEELDAARDDLLARAAQIRSGAFAATPGEPCRYCDFARLCPSRAR
jgi:RecB family exonuclease